FFFFQAEDGIRDKLVTGVQTCALPISSTNAPENDAHPCRSTSVNTRNWLLSTCNPRTWRSTMNSPSKTTTKNDLTAQLQQIGLRSEERRVGKECRSRW